jgi:putative PIN family toxin of toxin-antitoxin system
MRIVIDTNVLVSGIVFAGTPALLLDEARMGRFELCTSPVLLDELGKVLGRTKFAQRLHRAELTPQGIANSLRGMATIVAPAATPRVVPNDADDDHVIAAAMTAQADLIVSGDRHLLQLRSHQRIAIVTARQALERIAQ